MMVPVPGATSEEPKRGPGRPRGSGKSKLDDDDSLGAILATGISMLGMIAVQKRGAHWMPLQVQGGELGERIARYIHKRFPAAKALAYSEEVLLLIKVGEVLSGPIMMEVMMMMQQKGKEAQPNDAGETRSGSTSGASGGGRKDESERQPDDRYSPRDAVGSLVS